MLPIEKTGAEVLTRLIRAALGTSTSGRLPLFLSSRVTIRASSDSVELESETTKPSCLKGPNGVVAATE